MELWRDIPEYEGLYQVSSLGRIYSFISNKILSPSGTGDGYLKIKLVKNKVTKSYKVHRLVAISFIPNPNNLPQVNHINRKRDDNRVENLEWINNKDNTKYSYDKLYSNRYKNPRVALSEDEIKYILKNYKKGSKLFGANALARKFKVSQPTVTKIVDKRTRYMKEVWENA